MAKHNLAPVVRVTHTVYHARFLQADHIANKIVALDPKTYDCCRAIGLGLTAVAWMALELTTSHTYGYTY
ncbi:hypothetical protein [Occallatibacter savannae]|uniref:hypothetical protein n=1 Tax=Occallatibacter savannae TaxID=1002691 RepID=UPI0013A53D41|nr:hypothetical protein [Occallatibacter savannae]